MRRFGLALLALAGLGLGVARASAASDPAEAARGVLERTLGNRAADFHFRTIAAESGQDVYEVEAREGVVSVAGNSPVAMTRGAYAYLREACHGFQGWEGAHFELPARLPDWPKHRVASPYELRPYYNVCTLGYTTAYWDWPRWQRELDWMALHGINAAIAEVATEAIWDRVWKAEGLTQKELDGYFTGPAFMPWHRMGNINHWDGPPPPSFFPKQIALEKKIVARMRQLGISPIAPAFAGFVPPELQRVHPEAQLKKLSGWGDFTPEYGTYLLDPTSPLYPKIGRRYIQAWESEFGRNRYFLADSFNELKVPVPPDRAGRLELLARYGEAVYRSILAGDPDATWVMQGWLFYNDADFWDQGSAAALLSRVPNDRMVILDLACDFRPIWPSQHAFYGKQWVYSVIHNFGGKSSLGGDLKFFATDAARTLAAPDHGKLIGFGIAPEGIENNEVIYEMITDAMWTRAPIDLEGWLRGYCLARYGGCPDDMAAAWKLLSQTCYSRDAHYMRPVYQYQPLTPPYRGYKAPDDSPEYLQAVKDFLACAPELGGNGLYRDDAIELTVQYLGSRVDELLAAAVADHSRDDRAKMGREGRRALELMDDMDALLAAHPTNRLARWTGFARAWGDTPAESDYYEADAKMQVTMWGGTGHLSEYSSRVWSGLVRGYYRARWQETLRHLASGKPFDLIAWESKWVATPGQADPSVAPKDPVGECRRLLAKGEGWR